MLDTHARWLVCCALAFPSHVAAQQPCGVRTSIIAKLKANYDETSHVAGLVGNNGSTAIMELWWSKERGTWTLLQTQLDGISCIIRSGTNLVEYIAPDGAPL